jgi:hypothetical protein
MLTFVCLEESCMPKSNETAPLDAEAIAKRAYELYLQRGSVSGHELDDWLEAEAQLSVAAATTEASEEERSPVQPVVRRRSARGDAHPPSNRRV